MDIRQSGEVNPLRFGGSCVHNLEAVFTQSEIVKDIFFLFSGRKITVGKTHGPRKEDKLLSKNG